MATLREFDAGHFLFMVAKDIVVKAHGIKAQDWPETNFYTLISTVKCQIKSEHITELMRQYKVDRLIGYGRYFDVLPQEIDDEELVKNP